MAPTKNKKKTSAQSTKASSAGSGGAKQRASAGTKKSSSKSAVSTGKAAGKVKKTAEEVRLERENRNQLYAVIMFALGLLVICITLIKGDFFWQTMHNFLLGAFSWGAFLLGPEIICAAIVMAMDKTQYPPAAKIVSVAALVMLISGALQIFSGKMPQGSFVDIITELYKDGALLKGGGAAAAVTGIPLMKVLGQTGAGIVIVLLIFVFIMVLSGGTLVGLYRMAVKPVKKIEEAYINAVESRQETQTEIPEPSKDIDIPLDDDEGMPGHPVHSPKGSMDGSQQLMKAKERLLESAHLSRSEGPKHTDIFDFKKTSSAAAGKDKPSSINIPMPTVDAPQADSKVQSIDDLITRAVSGATVVGKSAGNAVNVENEEGRLRFAGASGKSEEKIGSDNKAPDNKSQVTEAAAAKHEEIAEEKPEYSYPPINLLEEGRTKGASAAPDELKATADLLVNTLKSFGVQTRIVDISRGPSVTRYELQPSAGVKISRITNLSDDIALNLAAAGVRIEAPIPNKAAIGIEVPNKTRQTVTIRELIDSPEFEKARSRLTVALGKDISGKTVMADLAKMPHLLIAGTTGSGKSVCINSMILSLLFKSSPDEVKLIMIDPKAVELLPYNGIPHLLVPVVTDPKKAAGTLGWAVTEMLKRYRLFAESGVRDLSGYNKMAEEKPELSPMPQIVIIIDELADLMMAAPKDVESHICRLAQMARAAGMHIVIATQRPSVDVVTGLIKANIPSRMALTLASQVDSRVILDMGGAEKLLGYGDMLFYPVGEAKPVRVQGCYVSDQEIERVTSFIKEGENQNYDSDVMEEIEKQAAVVKGKGSAASSSSSEPSSSEEPEDELLERAIECVVEAGMASTSMLQRRLKVGYARGARLLEELEEKGIIGPYNGSKPRTVLMTKEQYYEMKLNKEN